jgi:hypothetical protein
MALSKPYSSVARDAARPLLGSFFRRAARVGCRTDRARIHRMVDRLGLYQPLNSLVSYDSLQVQDWMGWRPVEGYRLRCSSRSTLELDLISSGATVKDHGVQLSFLITTRERG